MSNTMLFGLLEVNVSGCFTLSCINLELCHWNVFGAQPEDWDDEEDGEWTTPTIPNPDYKGPWEPKVLFLLYLFFNGSVMSYYFGSEY